MSPAAYDISGISSTDALSIGGRDGNAAGKVDEGVELVNGDRSMAGLWRPPVALHERVLSLRLKIAQAASRSS